MASSASLLPTSRLATLQHPQGLAVAEILLDCGFNCARWAVHWRGEWLELLWPGGPSHQKMAGLDAPAQVILSPYRFGCPVLFPFPNRIRGGLYEWAGRQYRLPLNDPQQRNAIHGLVGDRPWSVCGLQSSTPTTSVTGRFRLYEHALDRSAWWPSDFELTLRWTLTAEQHGDELSHADLLAQVEVTNCGDEHLPFGLGFHPYFAVTAGDAEVAVRGLQGPGVEVRQWELDELIPTGRLLPLAEPHYRLLTPGRVEPLPQWDDAFRLVGAPANSPLCIRVRDRRRGFTLDVDANPAFRDLVLFVPPHRHAVCIEPYTCVTNAINLYAQGVASGLQILAPGDSWKTELRTRFLPS